MMKPKSGQSSDYNHSPDKQEKFQTNVFYLPGKLWQPFSGAGKQC
jgi:hypothetical protein